MTSPPDQPSQSVKARSDERPRPLLHKLLTAASITCLSAGVGLTLVPIVAHLMSALGVRPIAMLGGDLPGRERDLFCSGLAILLSCAVVLAMQLWIRRDPLTRSSAGSAAFGINLLDFSALVGAVVILAAYAATVIVMQRYFAGYPSAMILTTRLPELAFGSYFVLYVRRVHWAVVIPAAAVLAVSAMLPEEIPEDVGTTIVGISSFLILVVAGRYVAIQPVRALVSLIARYSYPVFLVHHVVILLVIQKIDVYGFYPIQRYMLLAAECVIIFALSVALEKVSGSVVAFVTKAFKGMSWRPEVSEAER